MYVGRSEHHAAFRAVPGQGGPRPWQHNTFITRIQQNKIRLETVSSLYTLVNPNLHPHTPCNTSPQLYPSPSQAHTHRDTLHSIHTADRPQLGKKWGYDFTSGSCRLSDPDCYIPLMYWRLYRGSDLPTVHSRYALHQKISLQQLQKCPAELCSNRTNLAPCCFSHSLGSSASPKVTLSCNYTMYPFRDIL